MTHVGSQLGTDSASSGKSQLGDGNLLLENDNVKQNRVETTDVADHPPVQLTPVLIRASVWFKAARVVFTQCVSSIVKYMYDLLESKQGFISVC